MVTPIFILGIMPRCGSNYLHDLLALHPQCATPSPIPEDWLVASAPNLERFVRQSMGHWYFELKGNAELRRQLWEGLGQGLLQFLRVSDKHQCCIIKTPSVRGIRHFFKLFPQARLLVLIRDGRSVVESWMKSFPGDYETCLHTWEAGARHIMEFDRTHRGDGRYRIVRYEDLFAKVQEQVTGILQFMGLQVEDYDFEAAARLPVRGSSEQRKKRRHVSWEKPVPKAEDFDPLHRWKSWSQARHQRFNWVAGEYLRHFGYEPVECGDNRGLSMARNLALDFAWMFWRYRGPLGERLKGLLLPSPP